MLKIKLILAGLLIASVAGLGWWAYSSYTTMQENVTMAREQARVAILDRDSAIAANNTNLQTIKEMTADLDAAQNSIRAYKEEEAATRARTKGLQKRILELSKADPINNRPLSPVLVETMDAIFGDKR